MIDIILYIWLVIFIFLLGWFFLLQPKIGQFYLSVKNGFPDLFESCRPSLPFAKYNEQLVFLIFMYRKKYDLINDNNFIYEGNKFRRYIIINSCVTLIFFVVTLAVLAIGWSGNF